MATARNGWNALLVPSSPWAHLLVASERDAESMIIGHAPAHVGAVTRVLRGARCGTKREMLREWAAALQFPWYFGENWDSFEECVGDLSWLPARGYVLLVTHADRLLRDADALATLVQILDAAATHWADPDAAGGTRLVALPVSFHVVFGCDEAREDDTRDRFAEAGVALNTLRLP